MQQTKYALAVPKSLVMEVDFQPCSEGDFLNGRQKSVNFAIFVLFSVAQFYKVTKQF